MILLTVLTILLVLLLVAVLWIGLVRICRLLEDIGGATTSTPTSLLARIRWGVRAIERQTAPIAPQARRLAEAIGYPGLVVADAGHRAGARMRDFGAFADPASAPAAMLVECGQHWAHSSVAVAIATCRQFLAALDLVTPATLARLGPAPAAEPQRVIEVTHAITVDGGPFQFTADFQGLEVIAERGTLIARDGDQPLHTPYDDCVLIMPSRRLGPGQTAVRLGRFVA